MISTLLIANRGEIAARIIRTAARMGIRTVAVYSEADRYAPHVAAADTAVCIGPAPALESYLNIEAILEAAEVTAADAVHPGYGFLSERADFAAAVVAAGLTFVGPSAEVVRQLGRKDRARQLAVAAGVPVLPAWAGPEQVDAYPVIVKAAAGGGGKGMHIARDLAELAQAVATARREAEGAFGQGMVLIEKYVEQGRHVEVQVLGDEHGNLVHFFDRDCSTQRRHQKVIEEAPAPTVSPRLREVLTTAALAVSKQAGYTNAGTVEFLLDDATGEFYFLEMNTRLQVEHPVTEAIVTIKGQPLDLVEQQLRVAAGEKLSFTQSQVAMAGHAIEARVYAEDAYNGFLPQAGTAELVHWPARVRTEVGLDSGGEVSQHYDPMLGKLIAASPNREAARRALIQAIDDTTIIGVTHNLALVRQLLAAEPFIQASIGTAWLERNGQQLEPQHHPHAVIFAVWALAYVRLYADPEEPFGRADGWRGAGPAAPAQVGLIVEGQPQRWHVTWEQLLGPDGPIAVRAINVQTPQPGAVLLQLEIDGQVTRAGVVVTDHAVRVAHRGLTYTFARVAASSPTDVVVEDGAVAAPMPGTLTVVEVSVGEQVIQGQALGVVEAMKMEHVLRAPFAGTVATVAAAAGAQVQLGQPIFQVVAADA